jgi:uncharacterized protein
MYYLVFVEDQIFSAIREKLADAWEMPFPTLTRREATVVPMEGKAQAVIGMRRAGKTTFLMQCLADRLAAGTPRERLVYFNFEDERLGNLEAADLGILLDEYYLAHPQLRRREKVTWCLDEIQLVKGWEKFVRRMMDSERVEIFLSGSSARMLSREVATSMRGRALETVITPYSFREFARHHGSSLPEPGGLLSAAAETKWRALYHQYISDGGFPEAAAPLPQATRTQLLQSYVDTVIFRDVAERHEIGNLQALRAFVRQLLSQCSCSLSVSKIHADFRSRGISVSKETLLSFLAHLEDAFLLFTVPLACRSLRRQHVNPRKLYLADHSLGAAFYSRAQNDRGHAIENIVACELTRRSRLPLHYVKTTEGHEVDFLTHDLEGREMLIQVSADITAAKTWEREVRSLHEAGKEYPGATQFLLTESGLPRGAEVPKGVTVLSVWKWLLQG